MPEAVVDTVAPATVELQPLKEWNTPDTTMCREADAPWSAREQAIVHTGRILYTEGIEPEPRKELPGYDSGVMTLLIAVFLFLSFNIRHYSTFIKTFTQNLFSVRNRANVFDERNTMSETRVLFSLIILLCVCEGILLFTTLTANGYSGETFSDVLMLSGLAAAYYAWQLVAYRTVGYVFTSPARSTMWIKGFNASQSLLGITLVLPALLALFNPGAANWLLSLSATLYIIARIIFISKGFRIFYRNFFSLIYFILYLCSLEIIPLIIIYKAAYLLTSIL